MKIEITTRQILNILLILAWVIFVGLSIEAGGFITNAIFAIVKPGAVKYLWQQIDLSELFSYDRGQFFVVMLILSIVATMKATMFYQIIKTLHNKELNLTQPFNEKIRRFILLLSYITLLIGLFCSSGINYLKWLSSKGIKMPDTQYLHLSGADVWLFMAVVLFVIAQIFKRGIEIQTENELTI